MSLLTASKPSSSLTVDASLPVIQVNRVSVRYRVPQERIPSFKEYAIRFVKGQIRYHEFWALRHVNLEVHPGEVFGIIGPNGAGKSTLLKVVARVLRPSEGSIRVRGRVAPLLELGAGFDSELTGRENIYLNSAILGYSHRETERRVDRIIDFAGLHEFIDAPLRTYSTGMVARLGFAVATDERPEILIVDEVLSVGDAEFQTKSFERIQSFQGAGTTILLVSHSLERVEEMCARALWLDHGKVVALGLTKAVVDQYVGRVVEAEAERLTQEAERLAQENTAPEAITRWGNRKVEIVHVRMTDETGTEQTIFRTGLRLHLHMDYVTQGPVASPIFGIAIYRQDGLHITGPNTAFSDMRLPTLEGQGTVVYTIPCLPLLEGLYYFSVAVVNQDDTEIYDYQDRVVPFRVVNLGEGVKERYGLLTLQGEWRHQTPNLT